MRKRFDGMYYKHQKDEHTISIIAGVSAGSHAFIQVITNSDSYYFSYPLAACEFGETTLIAGNIFSKSGVKIDINAGGVVICGEVEYAEPTPIRYDIMGPFKYLPMECRHKVLSLHHRVYGGLSINGEFIDLSGGVGYIEGDAGISFPKRYTWLQCNDFTEKACITAAVAEIPLAGLRFRGCICVVYFNDTEYRLATYLGVKILCCDENRVVLKQGNLRLEIEVDTGTEHKLIAPDRGEMIREIRERIVCGARFCFKIGGEILFEQHSKNASFEKV